MSRKMSESTKKMLASRRKLFSRKKQIANDIHVSSDLQGAKALLDLLPKLGEPLINHHAHYYKDVAHLETVDVYRVLKLFNVTDPCLQHAIKKLLVAGGRGAGKDIARDVQEAIDSLQRMQRMMEEDSKKS